jgi:hypothetical protein
MTASFPNAIFRKACWIAALSLTGAAVLLHFFSLTQAGGLWRDEIAIANIATMPSWAETFRALPHDHCPIVFPAVVRVWTALGWAQTDAGLRVLGLGIGLFLLASFWAASRMMGKGLPLLSLAIVAVNPVVVRYGDSIRGYALGIAFIVLTMGLIWRFIEAPGVGRGLLAGVLAVVSVQTLYQNAFFLLAIGIGGVVVSLRQRQPAKAVGVLGIGVVAALSLLPYVNPIRQAQNWWVVSQPGTNLEITLDRLSKLNGPFFGVWVAVAVLAVVFGIGRAVLVPGRYPVREGEDLPLFGSIALVLGAVGFGVFIQLTGLLTQTWYYLPALCFTVVCCDAIVSRMHPVARIGVLVLAVAMLIISISPSAYAALRWRQTNGDLVAAQVARNAGADDLVIVHPWYFGLTYGYYYRGAAKWTTLPPIADYRFHRYDLIKEKLAMANPIAPVMERVATTLRSGNRVWVVGRLPLLPPDGAAPAAAPPPAPNGPRGWDDQPYSQAWGLEFRRLLADHVTNATVVVDPVTNSIPINPMERMTLVVAGGWKDSNQPVSTSNSETNKP